MASFISLLFSKLHFSQNNEERGSSWFMPNNIQAEKALTLFSGTEIKAQSCITT
jgi:hypothetical protein